MKNKKKLTKLRRFIKETGGLNGIFEKSKDRKIINLLCNYKRT